MNGRTSIALGMLAALLLAVAAPVLAAEGGEEVSVKGEILDMACYVAHGASGPDHAGCAKTCVKGGQPMGLLAEDGTVYLLYAPHGDASGFEAAKDQAGKTVELTGVMAEKSGIRGIEVHAVKPL